ncbi:ABC transporter ATP-binding protein [Arenibaculum pallidiluteum]|uniref:ABC transporter ATP-binding protein n=1 Tax=Arenibaculum pallidiluteum TaxID=2812559 RepID=UPI001A961A41|nr:ABC transporter ATP-binding protein [Arenibaculum pallidiluteum]
MPSAGTASPLLAVRDVTIQYRTPDRLVTAVYDVSFDVLKGDRFVLLGPSGCGKSTLLGAVAGFLHPAAGTITLDGREVRDPGPDRMVVFQEFDQLLPWKTVRANVAYPMITSGRFDRRTALERADAFIAKVGLSAFADSHPHTLSGGMKQRVAIARALALEPAMLLMDEPFAALDALTRRKMQGELNELWEDTRFTLLFVTHSIEEAIVIGNRILVMTPHPGQVRAELDASGLGEADRGTPAFAQLERRIHGMLFGEAHG